MRFYRTYDNGVRINDRQRIDSVPPGYSRTSVPGLPIGAGEHPNVLGFPSARKQIVNLVKRLVGL